MSDPRPVQPRRPKRGSGVLGVAVVFQIGREAQLAIANLTSDTSVPADKKTIEQWIRRTVNADLEIVVEDFRDAHRD